MCGIAPRHIRRLCDPTFEGGNGYIPQEVADMSLDTIFFLLAQRDNLRAGVRRVRDFESLQAINTSTDGTWKGVAEDGTKIERKIEGKSLARKLMERKQARELEEARVRDAANQGGRKRKPKT